MPRFPTVLALLIFPSALALLIATLCVASSAEARKSRSHNTEGSSAPAEDTARNTRTDESKPAGRKGGRFGVVIDGLVLGCMKQSSELQKWPFDDIARIAVPDEAQLDALDTLRGATAAAAQRLSEDCPRDTPSGLGERLQALHQAIDVATSVFADLEPQLKAFYASLDDEPKAHLVRDLPLADPRLPAGEPAADRRARGKGGGDDRGADAAAQGNLWAGICEDLTAALRSWPIAEIERGVRLTEAQRVDFYEFVTTSLKAAQKLVASCPSETPLTPVRRMATFRARLAAVREATDATYPALTRFYDVLDQGQRVAFAEMR